MGPCNVLYGREFNDDMLWCIDEVLRETGWKIHRTRKMRNWELEGEGIRNLIVSLDDCDLYDLEDYSGEVGEHPYCIAVCSPVKDPWILEFVQSLLVELMGRKELRIFYLTSTDGENENIAED